MSKIRLSGLAHPTDAGTITLPTENKIASSVGSIVAPGMIISTVYNQTNVKSVYSLPINTNTEIFELRTRADIIYPNSKLLIQFSITCEVNSDCVFRLMRNDVIIGTNITDSGRWSGWATPGYDVDTNTTPTTVHLMYVDTPLNTTERLNYKLMVSPSGGTAHTFYLNRSANNAGSDGSEVGISQVIIQEIAS